MLFDIFQVVDHGRAHHGIGSGGNIPVVFQEPAEDGNFEKSMLDDGFLFFEKGHQQDGIEIGQMVADNNR